VGSELCIRDSIWQTARRLPELSGNDQAEFRYDKVFHVQILKKGVNMFTGKTQYSNEAYQELRGTYSNKSSDEIFEQNQKRSISPKMDPAGVTIRECRDSVDFPQSFALMLWLDHTGSLGEIPYKMIKESLGTLIETIHAHGEKQIQVFFGGIGDQYSDKAPLQVGQFETGTKELAACMTSLYLEKNGGGDKMESYLLAWMFGARHTSIDCFEKRGQKGVLITVGDEASHPTVGDAKLAHLMGYPEPVGGITDKLILQEAMQKYEVFHIHVNEGSYKNNPNILGYWNELLPERLVILEDYTKISEVVATIVASVRGADVNDVLDSFDTGTALIVRNSIKSVQFGAYAGSQSITSAAPGSLAL
jgi:hypothetical protein